ncbi:MAG: hypothetical protein GVY12_08470 [Bacteroidetes bacterium]|jgi:uncharacterized surface protein with fasciclin (FAS1) repeats|nr:hypothetical protein [Bacteroidota bacterium]
MTTSTFSYLHRLVAVVLIGALGFLAACDDDTDVVTPPIEDDGTIADIVADNDDFSTLLGLLQGEGLTDALGDEDATFTVFAPTNAAFGPYDLDAIAGAEGAVGEILRYHVVQGAAVAAGDLTDGQTIETLAGDELTVSLRDGDVFIDGSQVTQPDVEADNGIIHIIDRTLIGNQDLANVAAFVNETSALFDAVAGAGLGEAFAGAEQWTVFGPNNATFENADLSGFTEEEIAQILQYHAVAGSATTSTALLGLLADGEVTLDTVLEGEQITIALDGEEVVFNGGQATLDVANLDYFASNGILHVIDGLLLPPALAPAEVELQSQALDLTASDSELLVTGITAAAGQTVVITTDNGDGDFTGETVVGSLELTENLQDGSVLVDVAGANPEDHAAHISTDGTVEGVTATSETAAIYAVAQFSWNDESYDAPTSTVTVDAIEILYNGTVGEDLVSIDLHAVSDGAIGAFVGISQEDLAINTVHNDVTIDVLEPRGGGDDAPRAETTIDETADFFAMTHLGAAGTDANGDRIPAQRPALLTTTPEGSFAPLVGDFATVEITGEAAVTIADVVAGDENFSTLLTALQEANLVDPLADETGTFTVFAPNNAAFGPINVDVLVQQPELGDVLGYHVVSGQAIAAADLAEGDNTVTTLAGDELTVVREGDNVFVEGSQVIQADIETDNGIIHVIDRTLLGNQNLANVAWFVDETLELYNAVVGFGLADAFINADGWTVFGPNNATFENADLSGFSDAEVAEVLQYHVFADDTVDSASLLALLDNSGGEITLSTLQGEDLTIALDGEQVVFNEGQATLDATNLDYFGSNGILHVIDGLLLPPSLAPATAISDARALADDEVVTIEGVLTRGKGRYLFFQDDTAGIMLFDFAGFNDELDSGDLAIGDLVRVNGRMDTFNDQRQLRIDDDAFSISVLSSGNALPAIPTITLNELNSNPEDYIHQLVRVESFTIDPDGDATFAAGGGAGNYTIDDGTDTGVLRLEGSNSSEYEGEPIPSGSVTFEGVVSRFQSTYQLHLALESDLTVD